VGAPLRHGPRPAGASYIGRSTQEAVRLGVHHAQAAAAAALAKGQLKALGRRARVVLTGGGASDAGLRAAFLKAFPPSRRLIRPDLVHLGLHAAWQEAEARRARTS
ncbi:MAG: hypothetical protein NTW87_31355, partial [Planctomycetota bacterium]|nr:hypothetical protein [Planctomycetota bacterium]